MALPKNPPPQPGPADPQPAPSYQPGPQPAAPSGPTPVPAPYVNLAREIDLGRLETAVTEFVREVFSILRSR